MDVQDTQLGIVQGVILMQGLVDGAQLRTANGHVLKNRARQIVAPTIFDNGFCLRISRYKNSLGGYKDGEGTIVAVRDGATVGKMFDAKPPAHASGKGRRRQRSQFFSICAGAPCFCRVLMTSSSLAGAANMGGVARAASRIAAVDGFAPGSLF